MKTQRAIWWTVLTAVAVAAGAPPLLVPGAAAQSWLPWTTREEPSRPPPRREIAPPPPNYGQFNQQPYAAGPVDPSGRAPICLQLEQRLAFDAQRQSGAVGELQKLRNDYNDALRAQRRAERELERRDCYESFLFTRSLRPSRVCHQFDDQARRSARRVEEITLQIRDRESGNARGQQDEIIRALARNNCGADYQREARRRDPARSFWQDNEGEGGREGGNLFNGLPFATYRTVCVRLCDGYYFPVSFSTLPSHFARDTEACQSKCAAPTELYFHQNPGGSVQQMVSQRTQQPYTSLRTAFRYRKEFVKGCSCKENEYVPQIADGAATAVAPGTPSASDQAPQAATRTNKFSPIR